MIAKTVTKNFVNRILISLFLVSMFGCVQTKQKAMPLATPTVLMTETPVDTPTSTPSPSSTPAYSYLSSISASNVTEVVNFDNYYGGVSNLAFSPNGKYLAATFENGAGIIWDISAVTGWREFHDAPNDIFFAKGSTSFNSASSILATGGTLTDLLSKKTIQELPGTVTFSPIGNTLALTDWTTISLWNFDGNQWILDYRQETKGLASVTFSPDGSLLGEALYWGGGDEGVKIWRVSDHKLLYSFPPPEHNHPAHFNAEAYAFLAFSPDNQFVATGTKDQPVVGIWNLQSGELIKDLNTVVETSEGDYYIPDIECVTFSQDSKIIILAGYNTIIFKKIPDGEFVGMLKTDNSITACATSPDRKLLVTGDSGGEVSIWGVPAPMP